MCRGEASIPIDKGGLQLASLPATSRLALRRTAPGSPDLLHASLPSFLPGPLLVHRPFAAFMQTAEFSSLLGRLRHFADEHQRDHWVQVGPLPPEHSHHQQ